MKKKKRILLFLLVIVVISVVIVLKNNNKVNNKIIETTEETAKVSNQSITTTITASGEVQSANTEKIYLNTNYNYLTMCAEKNEFIAEGSNLLKYTNGKYITAPYDCVITDYSVPGVKEGCTNNNYINISSVEDLYMKIKVGEDKISKISVGQEVDVIVNYDETKTYKGTISKINAMGSHSSGGTNFEAIALIKNDGNLKLGMSASCTITIDKHDDLACLPIEAIEIENNKKFVNKIKDDGTTEKIEIETGVSNANYVQIVSGLELEDEVKYEKVTVTTIVSKEESENIFSSMFDRRKSKRKGKLLIWEIC